MLDRPHPDQVRNDRQLLCRALSGLAVLAAVVCSGCGQKEVADPDPVAIEVGERFIRLSELQAQADFLSRNKVPLASDSGAFIEHIIERSIALEKAHELGLHEDPEIQRQIENLLIGRLKQRELNLALDSVSVTEQELQEYYEANAHKYGRPAQARFALLFLPTAKFMNEEARQMQKARLEEARQLAANQD
ncbi:MAG TPA: peptidylprolyl isomerase, partial [Opitutales bacterium]|nr:peptidylprolyl isomerase [Opitutales bacterium]